MPLRSIHTSGRRRETYVVDLQFGKFGIHGLDLSLAVDQMEGEPVDRVVEGHALAAAGCVCYFMNGGRPGLCRQDLNCLLQLFLRLHGEGSAAKFRLVAGLEGNHKWFLSIAPVEGLLANAIRLEKAEVIHKLVGRLNVLMLVVHMCDVVEFDTLLAGPHDDIPLSGRGYVAEGGDVFGCGFFLRSDKQETDDGHVLELKRADGILDLGYIVRYTRIRRT